MFPPAYVLLMFLPAYVLLMFSPAYVLLIYILPVPHVPSSLRGRLGLGVPRCLPVLLWEGGPVVQPVLLHGVPHRRHGGLLGPHVQLPVQQRTVHLQ